MDKLAISMKKLTFRNRRLGKSFMGYPCVTVYERGRMIIQRISKYRWLSPKEVSDLCVKMSWKYGGLCRWYVNQFPEVTMSAVGLYRGRPPAYYHEDNYRAVLSVVSRKRKHKDDLSIEIGLLRVSINNPYQKSEYYD